MAGMLILVSGQVRAGRAGYIAAALHELPQLEYLSTYTTRPRRPDEAVTHEHVFVDEGEYRKRREASAEWDHAEYGGYSYGADVQSVKDTLAAGRHIICSIEPDGLVLGDMKRRYGVEPLTIWIDMLPEAAHGHIVGGVLLPSRQEDEFARKLFTYTFQPSGDVGRDCREFSRRLARLLSH